MRVTLTSERAHNNQPATNTCLSNCSQLQDARSRTLRASSATQRYTCEAQQPHMHGAWPCMSRLPASGLTTTSQPPIPGELLAAARSRTLRASSATQRYTCEAQQTHITERILVSAGIHAYNRAGSKRRTSHGYLCTCRTARMCNIEDTLSQTSDAALHLVHTTNPHNQTHAPERKHPQLQRNEWQARTDS